MYHLKQYWDLQAIQIDIFGKKCGSHPKNVVEYAKQKVQQAKKEGNPYDHIFCVFDRDEHAGYAVSKEQAKQIKARDQQAHCIYSNPSFEYWLLSHYVYTRNSFVKIQQKSSSQQVESMLKNYCSSYKKSFTSKECLNTLMTKIEIAVDHAKKSVIDAEQTGEENPSTNLYELIECLEQNKA